MESRLLALAFVSVAGVVASQALPEVYWYSVLPNTPMPKFIQDLLPALQVGQLSSLLFHGAASNMNGLRNNKGQFSTFIIYHNAAASNLNRVDQLGDNKGQIWPFLYRPDGTTSEEQVRKKYQNVTFFFLENDLHPGVKINFPFDDHHLVHGGAKVLMRQAAQSIPFSSHKFFEILNLFSIKPESKDAFIMKKTIEACEEPGEDKYCATSLEGMVDSVASKLGNDVQALTSIKVADDDHDLKGEDQFLTISTLKMTGDGNKPTVACHGLNYVYPVFYCHGSQGGAKVYEVPLAGADGMVKAKATVVCHTNTSTWNPNHLSFQLLRVKPGTIPICHFLPENSLLWTTSE